LGEREREGSWKEGTVVRKESSQKGRRVEGNKVCVVARAHTWSTPQTQSHDRKHS